MKKLFILICAFITPVLGAAAAAPVALQAIPRGILLEDALLIKSTGETTTLLAGTIASPGGGWPDFSRLISNFEREKPFAYTDIRPVGYYAIFDEGTILLSNLHMGLPDGTFVTVVAGSCFSQFVCRLDDNEIDGYKSRVDLIKSLWTGPWLGAGAAQGLSDKSCDSKSDSQ